MTTKRLVLALAIVVLVLSTVAADLRSPAQQGDPETQAKALLAQKYGVPMDNFQLVGRIAKVRYPMLGMTIYEIKFLDNRNGDGYGIAINNAGQEVNVNELDAAEKAAYEARYGKLDKNLVYALRNLSPETMVEVDIWLTIPKEKEEILFDKPNVNENTDIPIFMDLSPAERRALKQQLAGEKVESVLDAGVLDSNKATHDNAEMTRIEFVTLPFADELRSKGFDATPNTLAPLVNVTMPVRQIRAYSKRMEVDKIYLSTSPVNFMDIARQVVGADIVNSQGYTGTGSKVAVIEYNGMVSSSNPYLNGITRDNLYNCSVSSHVTGISGIIRSTHSTIRGVAPDTNLWVGCGITNAQLQTITTRGNNWGADVYSLSWGNMDSHSPGALDKFYDNFMYQYYDTVVIAPGNNNDGEYWVASPAMGYNSITVGNFNDKNTTSPSDDVMASNSSWKDPLSSHSDREKPEVAAPGTNIKSTTTAWWWTGNIGSGTSYSTPMVAGVVSLLQHRNSSLKAWPEATKAIIMATAWKNKEGATRLSEKDGAGGVWAYEADWVARNNTIFGRWGGTSYSCSTTTNWDMATMYLYANYKTRVVIVWDQNPNYAYYSDKPSADLDLKIYNPSGVYVTGSSSFDNTYEIVEFTPSVTGNYKIRVYKYRCDLTPTWIGWAWSQP